jgi:dihydrodiol dehydrogenase / D-xylose 1-dehydrogenase (NADP)
VWTRFFPAWFEVRRLIAEGVIGEVKFAAMNFGFAGGRNTKRLSDPKLGGGAVLDVGVYPINMATMVFGEEPESVHASGWLMPTGVDEFAAITLK